MSVPFAPQSGLIIVPAAVDGPSGSGVLRLALDTGATGTVINVGMLVALGYDPALTPQRIHFPILGHTLPPSAGIDGLLGLDFVRGQTLTVDFRTGTITLT